MPISSRLAYASIFLSLIVISGCGSGAARSGSDTVSLANVPAVRLTYKYEADVPQPELPNTVVEERNAAIQADFDANRPQEMLDRTLLSPDKKHAVAVYRLVSDRDAEFRLDAYSPDGKLLRKITSDAMAVHFPDTIKWSPDSNTVAFVAMTRSLAPAGTIAPAAAQQGVPALTGDATNTNANTVSAEPVQTPAASAGPAAPTGILTFSSEQIYVCGSGGEGVKPITQNQGLIYFYYVWSPDSTMLAALAITAREWEYFDGSAAMKGENWTPVGRLRLVEKNGRERRLDDNLTAVRPVFSPDSTKVGVAYDTQIRLYDANGTAPTQAGIPLKNQLLISSAQHERDEQRKLQGQDTNTVPDVNANANANVSATPDQPSATLPNEKDLVSFNPIVEVAWTADNLLYFKTAFVKRMKNEVDSVTSFPRWHRLALFGQAAAPQR